MSQTSQPTTVRTFQRFLVANRSEIAIRVFRACTELGIRTIGVCSKEDRLALHRYKADETYTLDESLGPIKAYLDIPGIISIARRTGVDAIHPGYGFLADPAAALAAAAEIGYPSSSRPPSGEGAAAFASAARPPS